MAQPLLSDDQDVLTTYSQRQERRDLRALDAHQIVPTPARPFTPTLGTPATPEQRAFIDAEVTRLSARYGVDPRHVHAVIGVESPRYAADAVSPKGAIGLMQLIPETAKQLGVRNPFDVTENLDGGIRYLRQLQQRYPGRPDLVYAAYNAGPRAVERYGGMPPYPETQQYVKNVGLRLEFAPGGLEERGQALQPPAGTTVAPERVRAAAAPPSVPLSPSEQVLQTGIETTMTQALGGVLEATQQTTRAVEELADFAGLLPPTGQATRLSELIPQIARSEQAMPAITRSMAQFLTVFVPMTTALAPLGLTTFASGALAGAAADYLAFDPQQPNVSALINQLAPALKNPVTAFLATDPQDTAALNRFRNVIEGAALGVLAEAVTHPRAVVEAFVNTVDIMRQTGNEPLRNILTSEVGGIRRPRFMTRQQQPKPLLDVGPGAARPEAEAPGAQTIRELADLADRRSDIMRRIVALADSMEQRINTQRRAPGGAPRIMRQVAAEARELREAGAFALQRLEAMLPGTVLNDTETRAMLEIVGEISTYTRELSIKGIETLDPAVVDEFWRFFTLLGKIEPMRWGVLAELGRAMRQLGDPNTRLNVFVDQFRRILQDAPDYTELDVLAHVASLHSQEDIDKYLITPGRQTRVDDLLDRGAGPPSLPPSEVVSRPPSLETMSADDFGRLLDTVAPATAAHPPPPMSPRQQRRAATRRAATEVVGGLREAMTGLHELFGRGKTLGAGLAFDEDTYRQAVPHFQASFAHMQALGRDVREIVQALIAELGDEIRPYLQRFHADVQAGEVDIPVVSRGVALEAERQLARVRRAQAPERQEALARERAQRAQTTQQRREQLAAVTRAGGEFGVGPTATTRAVPQPAVPTQEELVVRAGGDLGEFAPVLPERRGPQPSVRGIERAGGEFGVGPAGRTAARQPPPFGAREEELVVRAGSPAAEAPELIQEPDPTRGVTGLAHAGEDIGLPGPVTELDPRLDPFVRAGDDLLTGPATTERAVQVARGGHPAVRGTTATVAFAQGVGRWAALGRLTYDIAQELWINSRLMRPITHIAAASSNTFMGTWAIPEEYLAAAFRGSTFGEANAFAYGVLEGYMDGFRLLKDGLLERFETAKEAGLRSLTRERRPSFERRALRLGLEGPEFGASKMDAEPRKALSAERFREAGIPMSSPWATSLDVLGEALRMPGRGLGAADDFQKLVNYRAELRRLAMREGRAEGLSGAALQARLQEFRQQGMTAQELERELRRTGLEGETLQQRVQQIVNHPLTERELAVHEAAMRKSIERVFQAPLGEATSFLMRGRDRVPFLWLLFPFMRTPVNEASAVLQRTPLAPFSRVFRENIAAGGEQARRAMANLSLGMGLIALAWYWRSQGHITGEGPTDPGLREALGRQNERPNSVRIGGEFIPYNRLLGMQGTLFKLGADAHDILANGETETVLEDGTVVDTAQVLAWASFMAIKNAIISKSYLQGLSDFVDVFDPPYGTSFEQFQAASLRAMEKLVSSAISVPALRDIERVQDPVEREAFGIFARVRAQTPNLSETLPMRRNLYAKPIWSTGGLFYDATSATYDHEKGQVLTRVDPNLIDGEIARLHYDLRRAERNVRFEGVRQALRLTAWQYDTYVQLAAGVTDAAQLDPSVPLALRQQAVALTQRGLPNQYKGVGLEQALTTLVKSPRYLAKTMTDEDRIAELRGVVQGYRAAALQALLVAYPGTEDLGGRVQQLRQTPQQRPRGSQADLRSLGIDAPADQPLTQEVIDRARESLGIGR